MSRYITIDIGGTNTRVALFIDGKIKWIKKIKTYVNSFDEEAKKIKEIIGSDIKGIEGIGISAPGPSDYKKGIFKELPNLKKWSNINFLEILKEKIGIKNILAENDANLMALAHHNFFKNNGITQFLTISTGLGAGLIINDKIFTGSNGFAQEVAKAPLAFSDEKNEFLSEGSLELFSSGSGIAFRSKMETSKAFNLYLKDENIKKIIDEGIEALANMIATSIAFINPNLFVFDGSVARNNLWYVNKAIKLAKRRSFKSQLFNIKFEFGKLGDNAALIGAFEYIKNNSIY